MPLYVMDYLLDTKHLSAEQHGVYLLLLMVAWRRSDGALPNDDHWLRSNLPSMHGRTYNALVPPLLGEFFVLEGNKWVSKRLRKEIETVSKFSRKQSENASKRYATYIENNNLGDAVAVPARARHSHSHLHKEDKIVEARAVFTEGSKRLADALWRSLGIETPLAVPPELAGTDWRAVEWERAGWTEEIVSSTVRRVGPGKPLSYYEKAIASDFAKLNAPLPIVEVKAAERLTVRSSNGSANSVSAVAKRWAEQFESQSGDDLAGDTGAVLRIPAR